MTNPEESGITARAEEIEPGSAERLETSQDAIDDARSAASSAADQDVTDVEFDPADGGTPGAEDQAAAENETADETAAVKDETAAGEHETSAAADEAAAAERVTGSA